MMKKRMMMMIVVVMMKINKTAAITTITMLPLPGSQQSVGMSLGLAGL